MADLSKALAGDFEAIKHENEGFEFWEARELMAVLGYATWRKFVEVIKKAASSSKSSGNEIADHFRRTEKRVSLGPKTERTIEDFLLTRFACYLIAQNGDPRKPEIAVAQSYFAIQTRKQEIAVQRENEDKRLESRKKLRDTEGKIESTVYARGIKLQTEFATFKNKHIEALYGGMGVKVLKGRRNIPENRALADFDTDVELKAKDFALAVTDHNIKKKNLFGKPQLEREVIENSEATRNTLISRGIYPEDLKPEEDLKIIEQRRKNEERLSNERERKSSHHKIP
jgi:DNA-damage-inducible protein D